MPQINTGGKYVFGWSHVRVDGKIYLPQMTIDEYKLGEEDLILISGSKISGGFCVSNYSMLKDSKLGNILKDNTELRDKKLGDGELIPYKGHTYCWTKFYDNQYLQLTDESLGELGIKRGDKLMVIRGSNIAFDCIVKGPLVESANKTRKTIENF